MEKVTDLLEVIACPAVQPVILSLELGVLLGVSGRSRSVRLQIHA